MIPVLVLSASCVLSHHARLVGPFTALPPGSLPPQPGLFLWLEGNAPGGGSLLVTGLHTSGVTSWSDVRGGAGIVRFSLEGVRVTVPVTTPAGVSFSAFALHCGDPGDPAVRCSYVSPVAPGALDGTPYTVLAVVRRQSSRGDNYFLMTEGHGCNPAFGGTGCDADSALHLGWSGDDTLRLGQYDHDVVLAPVPTFTTPAPLSLIFASSGPSGKQVGLLERGTNSLQVVSEVLLLANSGRMFVGGTPFGQGMAVADWHFVGDILALLIYTRELSLLEVQQATGYLRNRFGPA